MIVRGGCVRNNLTKESQEKSLTLAPQVQRDAARPVGEATGHTALRNQAVNRKWGRL